LSGSTDGNKQTDAVREFEEEVKFMKTIRHPNIVLFFGAGQDEDFTSFLVTEYMEEGSLFSILVSCGKNERPQLTWKKVSLFSSIN